MPKRSLNPRNDDTKKIEQLNRAIDAMLARADGKLPKMDPAIEPLVRIAADLRQLPRESFKARLKSEFEGRKRMSTAIAEPVAAVHPTASPRLSFKDAARAIEFYKNALGARETFRFEVGGNIAQAEMAIGGSSIMLTGEWPEGGRFSAETLGNSPISLVVHVDDVDSFAERAVAAGMKVTLPLKDQFYGHRDVTMVDPFGYSWTAVTVKEEMSVEEMHRRMQGMQSGAPAIDPIRKGFRTVTPYLVVQNAEGVIQFVKDVFGAEETFRDVGSAGGYHCEVRVDDSMLMIGGGAPGLKWKGESVLGAFHVYVRDCDAVYQRALKAGGKSLQEPTDQDYGERTASVADEAGNHWYMATFKDTGFKYGDAPTVQPYMHPLRAEPVIKFLRNAFGAEEMERAASPEGVILHTTLKLGTSQLEMGEAHGPYQPMKSMFYLYVPNSDAVYKAAITAGATSIHEPADQPYGDRVGAVTDVFGNQWYIGTAKREIGG
jgi:PhnB protein